MAAVGNCYRVIIEPRLTVNGGLLDAIANNRDAVREPDQSGVTGRDLAAFKGQRPDIVSAISKVQHPGTVHSYAQTG